MARPKVRTRTLSIAMPTVKVICKLLHAVVVENDPSSLKFLAHPIVILRKTLIQPGLLDCHLVIFSQHTRRNLSYDALADLIRTIKYGESGAAKTMKVHIIGDRIESCPENAICQLVVISIPRF